MSDICWALDLHRIKDIFNTEVGNYQLHSNVTGQISIPKNTKHIFLQLLLQFSKKEILWVVKKNTAILKISPPSSVHAKLKIEKNN